MARSLTGKGVVMFVLYMCRPPHSKTHGLFLLGCWFSRQCPFLTANDILWMSSDFMSLYVCLTVKMTPQTAFIGMPSTSHRDTTIYLYATSLKKSVSLWTWTHFENISSQEMSHIHYNQLSQFCLFLIWTLDTVQLHPIGWAVCVLRFYVGAAGYFWGWAWGRGVRGSYGLFFC